VQNDIQVYTVCTQVNCVVTSSSVGRFINCYGCENKGNNKITQGDGDDEEHPIEYFFYYFHSAFCVKIPTPYSCDQAGTGSSGT
jgi:hypothetical protein